MDRQWMTSIGLDVGTSTTKFVVSKLGIAARGSPSAWAGMHIAERYIEYAGPVFDTPLLGPDRIDHDRLYRLLEDELRKTGLSREEIHSGAVIITGETAAKGNAERLIHLLSDQAGDFVAATAGPDLEGILAGKGSGAQRLSHGSDEVVANIDVGGGTANVAYFRRGEVLGTVTFHIGGRLVRVGEDGVIREVAESIAPWLARKGYFVEPGVRFGLPLLAEMAEGMAAVLAGFLEAGGREGLAVGGYGKGGDEEHAPSSVAECADSEGSRGLCPSAEAMLRAEGFAAGHRAGCAEPVSSSAEGGWRPAAQAACAGLLAEAELLAVGDLPHRLPVPGRVLLSGGVAELAKGPPPDTLADAARYGDIGPLLAQALAARLRASPRWSLAEAEETVRATVIGAGSHCVELSGPTIHADEGALPVRNVPVVKVRLPAPEESALCARELADAIEQGQRVFGSAGKSPFALALLADRLYSYAELRGLADLLAPQLRRYAPEQTAVLVLERDMAKSLGQLLSLRLQGKPAVICIDNISLAFGDFIDIGKPVFGTPVPVIVKTLVFPER